MTGAHATIAHVSNPAVAAVVADARRRGGDLAAEACPQYFTLREDEVHDHGAFRKFTPPARLRSDEEEAEMWELVRSGVYTHFSTDHAPSTKDQKTGDIWVSPFGLPGLDTTFPFLIDAALSGKIELSDVARLYSEAPAKPRPSPLWPTSMDDTLDTLRELAAWCGVTTEYRDGLGLVLE